MNSLTRDEINALSLDALARAVELHVFGDDGTANTEERTCDAVRCFIPDGSESQVLEYFTDEMALQIWNGRHETEWQSALEAHVSAWRAEPPRRTVGELLRMLTTKYSGVEYQLHLMFSEGDNEFLVEAYHLWESAIHIIAAGDTPEIALMRALLIRHFEREGGK